MNFNTQGRRHKIVFTLVYINMSFWIYKNKVVDSRMLLITTMCIFCDQKR